MEERGAQSRSFIAMACVLGALSATAIWTGAYGISSGPALAVLLLSHVLVGGLLSICLVLRGPVSGIGAFLSSTTLLIAGPSVLGVVSPLLADLARPTSADSRHGR